MKYPPEHLVTGWRISANSEGEPQKIQKEFKNKADLDRYMTEVDSFSRAVGAKPESELPAHLRESLQRDRAAKGIK